MAKVQMSSDKKKNHEKQKERQRKAMKRLREARRRDPVKYEEEKRKERERYYKRKQEGKIKIIGQMTDREKRIQRKEWRNRKKVSKERNKEAKLLEIRLQNDTPPPTPTRQLLQAEQLHNREIDGRAREGKRRRSKRMKWLKKKINKLQTELHKEKNKKEKYRMRLKRLKNKEHKNQNSPNSEVEMLVEGQNINPEVKKKLLFSEVVTQQLRENYRTLKRTKEKRTFWKFLSGNVVKKYRQKYFLKERLSSFTSESNGTNTKRKMAYTNMKRQITTFLERDECSRLCPGKNDCITRPSIKKQKRILNDSLKSLHRKFMVTHNTLLSYATFCRMRPFWILQPKVENRDTCLCIMHTNLALIIKTLKATHVIEQSTPQEICKKLCCEGEFLKEKCLERQCKDCKNKKVAGRDFNRTDTLMYEKWVTKRVNVIVRGVEKTCVKTVKEKVVSSKGQVFSILTSSLEPFFLHVRNIQHQHHAIRQIKDRLRDKEALIHLDFSENYSCKYSEEVQSVHFGGSKTQLSLHTVVAYYKNSSENNSLRKQCFCTVSENLRHDPIAICAHLYPIFKEIIKDVGVLKNIQFLSDGPSTQYRNRKMFHLIANYLAQQLDVETIRWHYSEKGHGKGAPDGVGGVLKRTADTIVARGIDVSNLNSFIYHLQTNCKGIRIFEVKLEEATLKQIEKYLPHPLPNYKGILQCHEVVWARNNTFLDLRRLTCLDCSALSVCPHYSLGTYHFEQPQVMSNPRLRYSDVYSSSSDEENIPLAQIANKRRLPHYNGRYSEVCSFGCDDENIPLAQIAKKRSLSHEDADRS